MIRYIRKRRNRGGPMLDLGSQWHFERPKLVAGLALRLEQHQRIAMFGPRQTGKTTLLRSELIPSLSAAQPPSASRSIPWGRPHERARRRRRSNTTGLTGWAQPQLCWCPARACTCEAHPDDGAHEYTIDPRCGCRRFRHAGARIHLASIRLASIRIASGCGPFGWCVRCGSRVRRIRALEPAFGALAVLDARDALLARRTRHHPHRSPR